MRLSSRTRHRFSVWLTAVVLMIVPCGPVFATNIGDTYLTYMSPMSPNYFSPAFSSVLGARDCLSPSKGLAPKKATTPERSLMLATTTSVDATGLLNVIADEFQKETGIELKWIAVGTGAAIKQAQDGNADVVIVHARRLEDQFLRDGFGVNRRVIARNYFLIVGPQNDPARVASSVNAQDAFKRIKAAAAIFVSRGDKSGTHIRELDIWALAGGRPETNYLETGQGMAQTLQVAAERQAYTLTDSATYFALGGLKGLQPAFQGSVDLENIYSVIAVNPARIPSCRYAEAMTFIAFLTSPRGQRLIGEFKGKAGRPLFEPMAGQPGVDLIK